PSRVWFCQTPAISPLRSRKPRLAKPVCAEIAFVAAIHSEARSLGVVITTSGRWRLSQAENVGGVASAPALIGPVRIGTGFRSDAIHPSKRQAAAHRGPMLSLAVSPTTSPGRR